jgi:hypothetical protein
LPGQYPRAAAAEIQSLRANTAADKLKTEVEKAKEEAEKTKAEKAEAEKAKNNTQSK